MTDVADSTIRRVLWWICLGVAPAVLIALELFHPANFTASPGMYQFLSHAEHHEPQFQALGYFGPDWWFHLHMIQTPLVGLVAIGLWLTVAPVGAGDRGAAVACAWLARLSIFVFVVYYTVLDAVAGIGLGRYIITTKALVADGKLSPTQLDGVVLLLNTVWLDPFIGGVGSFVSLTGSYAVLAAAIFIAAALLLTRRAGWVSAFFLLAFGWQLETAHAAPHGPIAFSFLIIATGSMWLRSRRRT